MPYGVPRDKNNPQRIKRQQEHIRKKMLAKVGSKSMASVIDQMQDTTPSIISLGNGNFGTPMDKQPTDFTGFECTKEGKIDKANVPVAKFVERAASMGIISKKKPRVKLVREVFFERMRRERQVRDGKDVDEFLNYLMNANPDLNRNVAYKLVMTEFGYKSAAQEWDQEILRLDAIEKDYWKLTAGKFKETPDWAATPGRVIQDFAEAVDSLPIKGDVKEELDWIRAHPAMLRYERRQDRNKQIIITADDVLRAPHGKAPCRSAVATLQYWVNNPSKFYVMLMGEHRKAQEAETDKPNAQRDMGLDEIDALLTDFEKEKNA